MTMSMAGKIKLTPPMIRPRQPARRAPSKIVISVELGPGIRLSRAEQIEELLIAQPLTAAHDFVAHHADVRRRAAESERAQLEENLRHFQQCARDRPSAFAA